ncbi:MAG: PEP-CTERM sorting domain-containing protein [Deltaproteobacteria bacterium]|uniref:PEP-CTERM sorting domain-containing protein n=1 Tax=Desulfobacula sp. TaxID=2593537 RepID=UPI0019BB676E|nr:PEP-CTERM sorting domain-containing protein [Candidatus Desulfobacula maris]MBL6993812.1 PEP-CTERM sorting domain-containing protein [Desulfobacula sp.]
MKKHLLIQRNIFQALKAVCISTLLFLAFSQPVLAITVDGSLDTEYTGYYNYTLTVEGGKKSPDITMTDPAQLYYYQDTADLYLALVLPLSLVDNSYGANSVGWGKGVSASGKNHNLKDLEGSDKLVGSYGGTDFTIEYYLEDNSNDTATSLQWNYDEYSGYNSNFFSGDKYSPETNYNGGQVDYSDPAAFYTTTDPNNSDWIFEVIYEFKLAGITGFDINNFNIDIIHVSPNKIGKNKVYTDPPTPPTNPVPEPATMLLFGIGLLGIGAIGRKKHFQR